MSLIKGNPDKNSNLRRLPIDSPPAEKEVELSVVIPCLNEEETIGTCIGVALETIRRCGINGEVVVADNGSTDNSRKIAHAHGARVVTVIEKGYGNALMAGINAAYGRYIVMGDADASYDFAEIPKFLEKLRSGNSLVMGCRLSAGGGTVSPGAMPFLHRWIGNPFFSMLVRRFFNAQIHDVNCGLRGFTRDLYRTIKPRCTGMEFAVEMVIKASLYGEPIGEVPITLHKDGRINGQPHLKTFRDGWRTLRFFVLTSPRWLFLYPGILLIILGLCGYGLALPGLRIHGVLFDVHTLLVATMSIFLGYQAVLFSVSAKTFAISEGLLPQDSRFNALFRYFTLERGLILGFIACLIGLTLILITLNQWYAAGFGNLDYRHGLRLTIPGVLLTTLGFQTILGSFFLSILGMRRV